MKKEQQEVDLKDLTDQFESDEEKLMALDYFVRIEVNEEVNNQPEKKPKVAPGKVKPSGQFDLVFDREIILLKSWQTVFGTP